MDIMEKRIKFSIRLDTDDYEIGINPINGRGYFEHNELGDESAGGLWFANNGDFEMELQDYDGVFALPLEVYEALVNSGKFVIDSDFDPRTDVDFGI